MEEGFLQAILDNPNDNDTWLVLADWLEEQDQLDRAELVRLQVQLRKPLPKRERARLEKQAQKLLARGVMPCVPTITNSLGMRLALIPPGCFSMGSPMRSQVTDEDEFPCHEVQITRPFFLGVYQVTQEQYQRVMRTNPSEFGPQGIAAYKVQHLDSRQLPVDSVSFEDIQRFCSRLSCRGAELKAGRVYRLPTEAEWEYACRAGVGHSAYHFGSKLKAGAARFGGNGGGHPMPVGSYRPNLFGLYDLHGNVWEWCSDWYERDWYGRTPARDPVGPESGERRVLRGGGWSTPPSLCRSALRGHNTVDARHNYNGFRVALSVPEATNGQEDGRSRR
jgi:uncharacterized protein (TIGR02996 family)